MNTCDSSTFPPFARHENIVKGFSQFAASLPADHELKWLMFLLADNLNVSFSAMKDYFLSDDDI
ncbi:hypothetical protein XBP1_750004 [Xenorhabdus bovienii str. puntauvense]|uniref:Uncharacterized protein n=1 Tax=Xenorhabdus bovienii str. puntauvense TaxID=1398201 RepID=A0A077NLL1_XENBV|nr:hypothetical protein [Xenorhabdus bovienii]CDG99187.1 hypothetical protein XBP1_750004 [Xenorhabdus bovienii str. puntauvense]